MPTSVSLRNSIATRLLSIVFALYFLVTLTVTLIHMGAEYLNTKQEIKDSLEIYRQVFENSLEANLFDLNMESLQTQISGILQIPTIVGVQIFEENKVQVMAQGFVLNPKMETIFFNSAGKEEPKIVRQTFNELFYVNFQLIHAEKIYGQQKIIGEVVFYSSTEIVLEKVKYGFYFILINSIIKTFALWIIFLLVSRVILSRPLTKLTLAAESVDLDHLENFKLNIDAKDKSELKVLENTFNTMVKQLSISYQKQKDFTQQIKFSKQQLEKILDCAKALAPIQDKFTAMIQATQSIIRGLNLSQITQANIYFLEKLAKGGLGYAQFNFFVEVPNTEEIYHNLAGMQILAHSFSPNPPSIPLRLNTESRIHEESLFIPIYRNETLLGLIVLKNIPQADLLDMEKMFIKTLSYFLAVTLENISFNQEQEQTIRERTYSLQISLQNLDQINQQLELKHLQLQAEQTRFSQLGQMTAVVVHDFKNHLGVILGFTQILASAASANTQKSPYLIRVEDEATILLDLAHELLDFAKGQISLEKSEQNFGDFMLEMQRFLGNYLEEDIRFEMDLNYQGILSFDSRKFRRVLYNLVINAKDAMPNGGTLRISSQLQDSSVIIQISDTGMGIPPAIRKTLFERFVTYGKKNGTGIGTAVAKLIIEEHGGQIDFASENGQGTTFNILLPRT